MSHIYAIYERYMSYIYGETMERISKRRTEITRKKQNMERIRKKAPLHQIIQY
jgi:hypothetical protein